MQEFRSLELTALIDLLSVYTARYTKMLSEGMPKDDSNACREIIQLLQYEIETRKSSRTQANTTTTHKDITFKEEDKSV